MIIRQLRLHNFGIYGGEHEFDLAPQATGHFHRPVILFRGKNGVGKTTFVEAMRLCLHGSLSLGSRVAQQEYDDHLRRRIHRNNGKAAVDAAAVELIFDYVDQGQRHTYRVVRSWRATASRVEKTIRIWEDDVPLEHWDNEQADQFLRELAPPGILDIFFFDGERVQTMAENSEAANLLLADTIRALLGLDLVEQLGRDLDIYIARQEGHGQVTELQEEIKAVSLQIEQAEEELAALLPQRDQLAADLDHLRSQVSHREQQLASQGGAYAAQREILQTKQAELDETIAAQRKVIHDLCGGLMPFAIAPALLQATADRLQREHAHEQAVAARQVLDSKLDLLQQKLTEDAYWQAVGIDAQPPARQELFEKLAGDLRDLAGEPEMAEAEIIHRVSSEERTTLLRWIDQAQSEAPRDFMQAIARLNELEDQRTAVEADLARAPTVESLQPLLDELRRQSEAVGSKQAELDSLARRLDEVEKRRAYLDQQRARLHRRIQEQESDVSRLHLATQTQRLLADYKLQLAARKVHELEERLVQRFNQLCRKETFLDRVEIDPQTFQVTLYRLGREFSRRQLSAGENQLFAIATLWALREVSGRPVPVVIDTPLSRLDSEHRLSMIQEFFPHTSHQLIVLATDAEMDEEVLAYLQPALAHQYELIYITDTNEIECRHLSY